jgi:hypothetical protein
MLWAARSNLQTPWLARGMLGMPGGVLATLAANADYGAAHGLTGEMLSGWPAVAFVGSVEIALGMVRREREAHAVTDTPAVPVLETVPVPEAVTVAAVPVPVSVPEPVTATVLHSVPDTDAAHAHGNVPAGVAAAVSRYAADIAAGTLPGVRRIKNEIGCGTPKAQQILAHLESVAGA